MNYKVSRNNQEYGPYTLKELQQYAAEGNILPDDYAYDGTKWLTVSELLASPNEPATRTLHIPNSSNTAPQAIHSQLSKISKNRNSISCFKGCGATFLGIFGILMIVFGFSNIEELDNIEELEPIIAGIILITLGVLFLTSKSSSGRRRSGGGSSCGTGGGCGGCGGCGGGCGGGE